MTAQTKPKQQRHIIATFGRMNPIHIGHKLVGDRMNNIHQSLEEKGHKVKQRIYLSHSHDPEKNPLTHEQKVEFAGHVFGDKRVAGDSKARHVIEVMQDAQKHGKHLHMVVGDDRVNEFKRLADKYNGKEFKFDAITVHSAGVRDPDAQGVEGTSASKMREHAASGNYQNFHAALPKELQNSHGRRLFNAVRAGMGHDVVKVAESSTMKRWAHQARAKRYTQSSGKQRLGMKARATGAKTPSYSQLNKAVQQQGRRAARSAVGMASTGYAQGKQGHNVNLRMKAQSHPVHPHMQKVKKGPLFLQTLKRLFSDNDISDNSAMLNESLSFAARQQRSKIMKAIKDRLRVARKRAMRQMANNNRIRKRAQKAARTLVRTRVAGQRGKDYAHLSVPEKVALDKILDKKKAAIQVIAQRIIPMIRQREQQRLQRNRNS